MASSAATARNESQNPAVSAACGSMSSTPVSAADRTCEAGCARRSHCEPSPISSMTSVRWVGTEKPASNA